MAIRAKAQPLDIRKTVLTLSGALFVITVSLPLARNKQVANDDAPSILYFRNVLTIDLLHSLQFWFDSRSMFGDKNLPF